LAQAYKPRGFSVPLMPWIPAGSIILNIFLMCEFLASLSDITTVRDTALADTIRRFGGNVAAWHVVAGPKIS